MKIEPLVLGEREIENPFTIPSGIITITPDVIKKFSDEIPELGIITTKSVGLGPREGYKEPVFAKYGERSFINAVGLSNPGADEFAKELEEIYPLPKDKFLLTSIFASNDEEFVELAKRLEHVSDGFELNFSCPHVEGHGMFIGQSPELTYRITKKVKENTRKPVSVKLTPMAGDVKAIAKAAQEAGADALTAINTVGPMRLDEKFTGQPVLNNVVGGISGEYIRPRGIEVVRAVSAAVKIPVIAQGGIFTAKHIMEYKDAGASAFGIGSALTGLSTAEIKKYFSLLAEDMENETSFASVFLKRGLRMNYFPAEITGIEQADHDLKIFYFDMMINAFPGQFVFTWIPGYYEKPFSLADDYPLTLAVRKLGKHTSKMFELKKGDKLMMRGPYGNSIDAAGKKYYLVGGGTGAAPLYFIAKKSKEPVIFLGGKSKNQLLFRKEFEEICETVFTTEDGSYGIKGLVTDGMRKYFAGKSPDGYFFNCGPERMMAAAAVMEKELANPENIYMSIERYMKCGVGICGVCSIDGTRSCVDGPVYTFEQLAGGDFGKYHRSSMGARVEI